MWIWMRSVCFHMCRVTCPVEGLCDQPFPCRVPVLPFNSPRQPWRATYGVASRALTGRAGERPFPQTAEAFAEVKCNGSLLLATYLSPAKLGSSSSTAHSQSLLCVVEVSQKPSGNLLFLINWFSSDVSGGFHR